MDDLEATVPANEKIVYLLRKKKRSLFWTDSPYLYANSVETISTLFNSSCNFLLHFRSHAHTSAETMGLTHSCIQNIKS